MNEFMLFAAGVVYLLVGILAVLIADARMYGYISRVCGTGVVIPVVVIVCWPLSLVVLLVLYRRRVKKRGPMAISTPWWE